MKKFFKIREIFTEVRIHLEVCRTVVFLYQTMSGDGGDGFKSRRRNEKMREDSAFKVRFISTVTKIKLYYSIIIH